MVVRVLQWLPDRSGFSRSNSAWVALDMQVVREMACCQLDFSTFSIGVIASSLAAGWQHSHMNEAEEDMEEKS